MKKFVLLATIPFFAVFGSGSKKEVQPPAQYIEDFNAGVDAQKSEDYQAAIQYYLKAVAQKPDFADALNNLGYCYRMIAKSYLVKSGDSYDKAIKYSPKHERAIEYQGEYYLMVGQLKNAYSNYQTLDQMKSDETGALKIKLDAILKQAQSILNNYKP